ncbi:MAG: glycoside hydrolase family 3 C-terminal domain-containing protein [Clostridia bacterium]|nr:glycoside hydrolase family 3 C-terminal domain-containing protein [Clostridia bacterium]
MRKALHLTAKILFNIAVVLLGVYFIVSTLVLDSAVEGLLTDYLFKDKPADVIINTGKEPVRYKTWYSSVEDNLNGSGEMAWFAQAEGTVLLQNDGNVLPLSEENAKKVSLFGVEAYDPMYCVDGAGNNKINDPAAYGKSVNTQIYRRQYFYDEFEKAGLDVNETLKNWYTGTEGLRYRRYDEVGFNGSEGSNGNVPKVVNAPWSELNATRRNYASYGRETTAIFITGRMTNEGTDSPNVYKDQDGNLVGNINDADANDYMVLTDNELDLIAKLKENYSKLIVIFNQAAAPQSDLPEVLKSTDNCNVAAMWIGFPGSDGIKAVADILVGTVNPSGGLTAGWYAGQQYNPSMRNYGNTFNGNVVYMEGMYLGYRYAETRYEDALEGGAEYDYDHSVSYPFGYGLSYTTFDYSDITVEADPDPEKNYYTGGLMAHNNGLFTQANGGSIADGYHGNYGTLRPNARATGSELGDCDDLIVNVTVTNNGSYAGKEIVQIYLQQPITEQDRQHKVEKPAVQLVGYAKTDVLAPDESETVKVKIDANKWFAAYDAFINGGAQYTGGGYVLAAGDYYLVAARNAHEAVNSIYRKKHDGQPMDKLDLTYGAGSKDNVAVVNVSSARSESYEYWTQGAGYSYYEGDTENKVTTVKNLFADLDPNTDNNTQNDVKYFSRYDWNGTASTSNVNGLNLIGENGSNAGNVNNTTGAFNSHTAMNAAVIDVYEAYYKIKFDSTPYTYGDSTTEWQLVDMIGIEFDPAKGATEEDIAKWDQIVGQLHINDANSGDNLFSTGRRQTVGVSSIGKPTTADINASNGFEWLYGRIDGAESNVGFYKKFDATAPRAYPTGYPCEGIIAASFNNEVAYLVGQSIGEDALWSGVSGIYGFGLGLQRNPYHGRTGEYYSDDPFLTGMMAGYETLGAQQKGLYVYNKHFVLNDQEFNRTSFKAWLSEQTLRQLHLRPFEMAIEIGDAMNVMIAFNLNGNSWGGSNYNLMTRYLRGEAGMSGFAVSDWYNNGVNPETLGYGILGGCDLMDGPVTLGSSFTPDLDDRYKHCVVQSAKRILYTVANSNAMNFIGEGTTIYTFDAQWIYYRDVLVSRLEPALITTFAICYAFVIGTTVWSIIDNRKSKLAQGNSNPVGDDENVADNDGNDVEN